METTEDYHVEYCHKFGQEQAADFESIADVYRLSNFVEDGGGWVVVTRVSTSEILWETQRKFKIPR